MSLGDFNSCMDVENYSFDGKYCLALNLHVPTFANSREQSIRERNKLGLKVILRSKSIMIYAE